MKVIAFYLPQFHCIPENDTWWGSGFTEWTNVKKAKPFFKGHAQPKIPLENNYYNLLDPTTQEWQSSLALKYGISGFCYYHYWFDGKLLLEKPMEQMVQNSNIRVPFCICWANETWSRTWDGKNDDVLIKQNPYESREGWKKHFEYLLPFFQDKRYLKDNGRPILIIYKPYLIDKCDEMIEFWRMLAKKNGFPNLFIGFQHSSCFYKNFSYSNFDFGIEFEPLYTYNEIGINEKNLYSIIANCLRNPEWGYMKMRSVLFRMPNIISYDYIWNKIICRNPKITEIPIFPGAFPSWDNSPRKGNKSIIFKGSTPEKFKKYFSEQIDHVKKVYNSEYIFINAWNEWGEGAYLEPDEQYGYGYLEALKAAIDEVKGEE